MVLEFSETTISALFASLRGGEACAALENLGAKSSVLYTKTPAFMHEDWNSGFTNPRQHGEKFRYLIHGIGNQTRRTQQKLFMLKDQADKGGYDSSQDIDLLSNPHQVSKKKIISTSCIDENHRAIYGDAGLILEAPVDNVLDMSSQDAGTDFTNPAAVLDRSKAGRRLTTLSTLMNGTSKEEGQWNEIRLTGQTESGIVKVVGFFIKVDKYGQPTDPEMAQAIEILAFRHGLPLIQIKKPLKEFVNEPAKLYWMTALEPPYGVGYNRDSQRYFIVFHDEHMKFQVINDEGWARSMTKNEAKAALQTIEHELPADQLAQVIEQLEMLRGQIENLPEQAAVREQKHSPAPAMFKSSASTLTFQPDFLDLKGLDLKLGF